MPIVDPILSGTFKIKTLKQTKCRYIGINHPAGEVIELSGLAPKLQRFVTMLINRGFLELLGEVEEDTQVSSDAETLAKEHKLVELKLMAEELGLAIVSNKKLDYAVAILAAQSGDETSQGDSDSA